MNVKAIRLYVLLLLTSKAHALPFLKGAKAFIVTSNFTSDNANITQFDILPLDTINSAVCSVTTGHKSGIGARLQRERIQQRTLNQ